MQMLLTIILMLLIGVAIALMIGGAKDFIIQVVKDANFIQKQPDKKDRKTDTES